MYKQKNNIWTMTGNYVSYRVHKTYYIRYNSYTQTHMCIYIYIYIIANKHAELRRRTGRVGHLCRVHVKLVSNSNLRVCLSRHAREAYAPPWDACLWRCGAASGEFNISCASGLDHLTLEWPDECCNLCFMDTRIGSFRASLLEHMIARSST